MVKVVSGCLTDHDRSRIATLGCRIQNCLITEHCQKYIPLWFLQRILETGFTILLVLISVISPNKKITFKRSHKHALIVILYVYSHVVQYAKTILHNHTRSAWRL